MGREAGSQWFLEKSEQTQSSHLLVGMVCGATKQLHYNIKDR